MKVKLGELTKIRTGKLDANAASENGEYPFFTCSKEPLRISTYSYDCECVLVAGNGDLNVKYYNGKFDAYQRTYIIESKDKTILTIPYLYRFLEKYVETLRTLSIGGVIKYIKLGNLTEADIEIRDINEQKKIVSTLEKIDSLLNNLEQQLLCCDDLIKSRFIEMFGDPVTNPMGWKVTTIGQVTTDVRYGTSAKANDDGQYKYLRMNNLTYDGYLDLSDLKHIDVSNEELEKCVVRKGDVLFNRTNSTELVGKTALFDLDEDMVIAGYIIRVRLHDIVSPVFFTRFMNMEFMKKQLRSMAKGAVNQANINAQELKAIAIYVPPIELQNEFADFVEQTDKSKLLVQQSINTLQTLKDKLMQDYFG